MKFTALKTGTFFYISPNSLSVFPIFSRFNSAMADAGVILHFPSAASTTGHGSVGGPVSKPSSRNASAFATKGRAASSAASVTIADSATAGGATIMNGNGSISDTGTNGANTGGPYKQSRYMNAKNARSPPTESATSSNNGAGSGTSPSAKKRRKVNHGE